MDNLQKNNPLLNTLVIKKLYEDSGELVFINYKSKVDTNFLEKIIEVNPITIFSEFKDVSSKKIIRIFIIIEEGKFLLEDLVIINAYIKLYPEKIAIGIDSNNNKVAIEGWVKSSKFSENITAHF